MAVNRLGKQHPCMSDTSCLGVNVGVMINSRHYLDKYQMSHIKLFSGVTEL